jgi:large subunit ribosomal protein L35
MPKLKTRKAALKRYKITGSGKFLRRHAYKGHLLMKKSNVQKRKLSQKVCVTSSDSKPIKLMLPYSK